jgi:hypothetical protein
MLVRHYQCDSDTGENVATALGSFLLARAHQAEEPRSRSISYDSDVVLFLAFSRDSFSRMNVSISAAPARMRSHCSL